LFEAGLVRDETITGDEYDGYIAGFGPSVITAGLLPTLATYLAHDKRKKVLNAIASVANIESSPDGELLFAQCLKRENRAKLNLWKVKITDASIALKLMIRTFNHNLKNP